MWVNKKIDEMNKDIFTDTRQKYSVVLNMIGIVSGLMILLNIIIGSSAHALIQRSFKNLSFEDQSISSSAPCRVYAAVDSTHTTSVPGWSTTHPNASSSAASNRVSGCTAIPGAVDVTSIAPIIEVWQGPRTDGASPAHQVSAVTGSQFIELNAEVPSSVYQAMCFTVGESFNWKFSHRGRNGIDVAKFTLGGTLPAGSPYTINGGTTLQTASSDNTAWSNYSGSFTVPAGLGGNQYFGFSAVSAASGSNALGNFLDDIQAFLKPAVEFKTSNYTQVENAATQNMAVQVVGIVPAGGTSLNFTIDPSSTAVIGTDYTINGGNSTSFNIVIPAGDYSNGTTITVPVQVLNNSIVEGSRFFKVNLTPDASRYSIMPTNACTNAAGNSSSTYDIQDDDIGLKLNKTWVNATVSDKATLTTTGGGTGASNISIVSNADTANETDSSNTIILAAGNSRTLAETLNPANTGSYSASAWSCTGGTLSGSVLTTAIADYGTTIGCTITNTRNTTLQVAKAWGANSSASDSATVPATTGGSANTTGFTTAGGTSQNSNTVTITVGNTITFPAETGTNIGNYTTVLSCLANGAATANNLSGTNGQVSNTLVIGAADSGKALICTYTNTSAGTDLAITKTGTSTTKAGQQVSYTIKAWNKGPIAVTDAVITDIVPSNLSGVSIQCTPTGSATCGTIVNSPNATALTAAYTAGSNTRSATGVSLPVDAGGNTNYVTYTVTGLAYATGTFTNTATISSPTVAESDNSNNSASQTTTITTDSPITTGNAANQCLAAEASNVITQTAVTQFNADGGAASTSGTLDATVSTTGTGYGTATNGGIVLNGQMSWSYGNPIRSGSTLTIQVNGTDYGVLTTPGASSNGTSDTSGGVATFTALNGATVSPATFAVSYAGQTNFTVTLPTTITSIVTAKAVYLTVNPLSPKVVSADDFKVSIDSALQCLKPIVKIAKISNGGTGTFSFNTLTNLSNSAGTAVTTDSVATVTAATAANSAQTNYATALGTAVNMTEAATANYVLNSLSCTDSNSAVTGNSGTFASLAGNTATINAAAVKYGANILCTFTNTKQRNLTLKKTWVNATVNDAATITATGLTSLSAVANTANETDSATAQLVNVGNVITLGETITTGTGNYNAVLSCTKNSDNSVVAVNGSNQITIPDGDVSCTYTNTRKSTTFRLAKAWGANSVAGNIATLGATTGLTNNTASFTSTASNATNGAPVTVFAGETATLPVETMSPGTLANYNTVVSCNAGALTGTNGQSAGNTIAFNAASTTTSPITCTYTNTPKTSTLQVAKAWGANSSASDSATVPATTGGSANTTAFTTAGGTSANSGTAVNVTVGNTITFPAETGTNIVNYNTVLSCLAGGGATANSLSGTNGQVSNTLVIGAADSGKALVCTYTNSIKGNDLAIDKTAPSSVTQGNNISYTIKIWNKGPTIASSSTFIDTVPASITNVTWACVASGSAVCGTASGSGNTISVTTGALPVNNVSNAPTSGSYLVFTVTGTTGASGSVANTATIAVVSGSDPNTSNNSSQATTTVNAPSALIADAPQKEARFVITPNLPTIFRGQTGTQLVDIKNEGPNDATGTVASFKLRPQIGITVTGVKIAGGANCSLSAGSWSCPVGSVANGASFQLEVSYDTTSSAVLGTGIQADVRVNSNEFNPGSGVGESVYRIWGAENQQTTPSTNGAFMVGYTGTGGNVTGTGNGNFGAFSYEGASIEGAWPANQSSPTGGYLDYGIIGANNSYYLASTTSAQPMISRLINSLTGLSVKLPLINPATNSLVDNRRAWEIRTGALIPASTPAQQYTLCIGDSSQKLDDSAYIMVNGVRQGIARDNYSNSIYTVPVTLNPGYNQISYRIANRNTTNGNGGEVNEGGFSTIGVFTGGSCLTGNLNELIGVGQTASINVIDQTTVAVSGQVFEDNSGTTAINSNAYNGIKDAGEVGIAGSSVKITNCAATPTTIATTQTNANGEYSFSVLPSALPAGNFCIVQSNLADYSSVSGGSAGGTTGYTRSTDTITISNSGASSYTDNNFGDARLNVLLTEDGQQSIIAGGVADYPHRLTAQSVLTVSSLNQNSSQQPANSNDAPWQALLYRDTNCNGKLDSGEDLISASLPLSLKANEQVCLVQRVYAPATASLGAQHIGSLQASFAATLADSTQITGSSVKRQDTTLLGSAGLSMQKVVRNVASCPSTASDTSVFNVQNQAQSGGYLEYEITYRNNSNKNLVNVKIRDTVPAGTVYQTNTCTVTPSGTCTASNTSDALLWQNTGTLLPSQQGTVRFCVQVP